ncbi:MAG: lipoyl(octanoyl) transferase [Anaerolineae bacterium]
MAATVLDVQILGRVQYQEAYHLQKKLVTERIAGLLPDILLLMEHAHTFTLGRSGREEQVLIGEEERKRRGIELHRIDSSGDVAYHGPGKLTGWAILNLAELQYGYHNYLDKLEEMLLRVLAHFGVPAHRAPARSGVWVPIDRGSDARWTAQIANVDAVINDQGITSFGFSLNVNPNLRFFDWIMPYSVHNCSATSLAVEASPSIKNEDVIDAVVEVFVDAFNFVPLKHPSLTTVLQIVPDSISVI